MKVFNGNRKVKKKLDGQNTVELFVPSNFVELCLTKEGRYIELYKNGIYQGEIDLNLGKLTGREALTTLNLDWKTEPIKIYTLPGDRTFTFSNLVTNKCITFILNGNHTPTFPAYVVTLSGSYDGTKTNYIQLLCTNDTTGSEQVLMSINPV